MGISAQQSGEFGRMDEDEIQDKVEYKAHVEDRVEDGFEESKIKRTMGTR